MIQALLISPLIAPEPFSQLVVSVAARTSSKSRKNIEIKKKVIANGLIRRFLLIFAELCSLQLRLKEHQNMKIVMRQSTKDNISLS